VIGLMPKAQPSSVLFEGESRDDGMLVRNEFEMPTSLKSVHI